MTFMSTGHKIVLWLFLSSFCIYWNTRDIFLTDSLGVLVFQECFGWNMSMMNVNNTFYVLIINLHFFTIETK